MNHTCVIAIVCLCFTSCDSQNDQPFYLVWPEDPEEISDAKRVAELCKRETGETPWLVDYRYSQMLGKTPRTAFLRPDSQSSRVRRGRAFVNGSLQPYAQVAKSNENFTSELEKPAIVDRPFLVQGQFSDGDLIGIVAALRQTSWLNEHYILDMRRAPPLLWHGLDRAPYNVRGDVGVKTENGSRFCMIVLKFTNQVWEIVSYGCGVR